MQSDPRLDKPLAAITALCELVAVYNHPLTSNDGVSGGGKPTSRPPGQQNCPWAVRQAERVLLQAKRELCAIVDAAQPRERKSGVVTRVGGVEVTVREQKVATHLVRKWGGIVVKRD